MPPILHSVNVSKPFMKRSLMSVMKFCLSGGR